MNHTVSDFIIRLKNAAMARRHEVVFPYSKLSLAIGKVLVAQRFLKDIKEVDIEGKKALTATIAYGVRNPFFSDVKIISKPSLRVYAAVKDSALKGRGLGVTVVSTSHGIMTGKEASEKGFGGEVLFRIW